MHIFTKNRVKKDFGYSGHGAKGSFKLGIIGVWGRGSGAGIVYILIVILSRTDKSFYNILLFF